MWVQNNTLSILMLEVQADGTGSQSWILLQCKDQGSFVPWFSPRDIPSSLSLSLGVALRAPSSPLNLQSSLPPGPSVHTIAVDQNYGQHVILAQHSPASPPASAGLHSQPSSTSGAAAPTSPASLRRSQPGQRTPHKYGAGQGPGPGVGIGRA